MVENAKKRGHSQERQMISRRNLAKTFRKLLEETSNITMTSVKSLKMEMEKNKEILPNDYQSQTGMLKNANG